MANIFPDLQSEAEFDLMRDLEYYLALVPSPIHDSDKSKAYFITLDKCRKYLYDNLSPFFNKHK